MYLLTGEEKLPLPEETPDCRKASKALLQLSLTACGGQVRPVVKHTTELESPELDAAWHELGFRCELAGEPWPNPLLVKLSITELDWRITEWAKAPGSADSLMALAATRTDLDAVLAEPRKAACVELPLHGGGHWVLLTLWRPATPEGQDEAEKLVVTYRDALPMPSAACEKKAQVALSFLIEAIEGTVLGTAWPTMCSLHLLGLPSSRTRPPVAISAWPGWKRTFARCVARVYGGCLRSL